MSDKRMKALTRFFQLYAKKIILQMIGFALVAWGTLLFLYSDLGLNSWGLFHQGLSLQTPLTFGQAAQAFGSLLIIISLFFRVIPGLGTILNMFFIGIFIDLFDSFAILYTPNSMILKLLMLLLGIVVMAYGMFFYLKENLGAGPKDGVMILLHRITNLDIGIVRTAMEVSAVIAGYLLGGDFGIGTIISAFTIGPALSIICKLHKYKPKETYQENVIDTFKRIAAANE